MKAVVCKAWGLPETLVVEELPEVSPKAGEVMIDIFAAGVNFPDVLIIQNKYQFKPELPFTPGNELAGVVRAVGEGVAVLPPGDTKVVSVEHPTGEFSVELGLDPANPQSVTRSALLRTARLIMRGEAMVPWSVWNSGDTP